MLIFLFLALLSNATTEFDPAAHPEYRVMPGDPTLYQLVEPKETKPHFLYGYHQNANTKVRHLLRTQKEIIWDVTLDFDENGFRRTPQPDVKKNKFLAFFGCSYTLGTGVHGHETLPAQVGALLLDHHVYNLAVGASAMNMTLAFVRQPTIEQIIKEDSGVFVYVPILDHIPRANGFLQQSRWMRDTPYFVRNIYNGQWNYAGRMRSVFPIQIAIYDWVNKYIEPLVNNSFNYPRLKAEHIQYSCDLTKELRNKLVEKFPHSDLIVLPHPLGQNNAEYLRCLNDDKIRVYELPVAGEGNLDSIPYDGHPSAHFNKKFAQLVADSIRDL